MAFASSVSSHGITSGGLIHKSTDQSFFFGSLGYNANCKANHFPVAQMDHWNVLEYFTFASEREIFSAANGLV